MLEPASGSVIAKTTFSRAVGQPGQPLLALLLGAVLGDHRGRDRVRDQQQQHRCARRGGLLADQGELDEPAAPAAVGLRDRHPDVAGVAERVPELGALDAAAAWST